jgi:hypothetical protein
MILLGESSNVIPERFVQLLSATLQIPRFAWPHVCALEVDGEDVLEILPTINHVSRQVVGSGPSRVGQVNGEELDDEDVIIRPTRHACEAIVLQPNVGICLTVVFDDIIWCPETFWETRVMRVAPECLGPWPIWARLCPLVNASDTMWVTCAVLEMCALIPPAGLMACQGLRIPVRMVWPNVGRILSGRGCAPPPPQWGTL